MTTYEWSFPNFETNSENVVKTIHWRYTAVDGETLHLCMALVQVQKV
jgi:hypothetical protein